MVETQKGENGGPPRIRTENQWIKSLAVEHNRFNDLTPESLPDHSLLYGSSRGFRPHW
jgi:hypothetical protein